MIFIKNECSNDINLLRTILGNDILNDKYVQEKIIFMERKKYLEKHGYKIWQGKDNKWYTRIPDEKTKYKNRLVKRTTEEDLENFIINYYKSTEEKPKLEFCQRWDIWMNRQKRCGVSDNTINKYKADYRRFILDDELEHMNICKITDDDLKEFIIRKLKNANISYKALKSLYGYLLGVFEKTCKDKIIEKNPCVYLDLPEFKKLCSTPKIQRKDERILNDNELQLLKMQLNKGYSKKPYYITQYAVEFAIYTGMRVGEISALKWENISFEDKVIIINASEKYNRETKEYFIDKTKNGKERYFPLTEQIEKFLVRLKKVELQYNYLTDFVFSNENGRIHAKAISSCAMLKTEQAGIGRKSIHALRRTLNSKMKCMGVSSTVAASLLGHTEKVNQNNYTYDVTNLEYKMELISKLEETS